MWFFFTDMSPLHVLAVLSVASSVTADYYVDNANNTVSYKASGTEWQIFSFATQNLTLETGGAMYTVDSSQCYDQNYALATCTIENNCVISFPFTGSGLSIFVMHAGFQGMSASLTVDGGQTVTATLPPATPPSYQTPNVSLFNLQSLPSADHTATINLLDWENGTTSLYFDYALINESFVELSASSLASYPSGITTSSTPNLNTATTQSSATRPTNASSASSLTSSTFVGSTISSGSTSPRVNLGALVGGTCGGLAALVSVVTAIIFLKRRKSRLVQLAESQKAHPFPTMLAPAGDQIVPLPVHSQLNQKAQLHSSNMAVHRPRRPCDDASSDFHTSSLDGRASEVLDLVAKSPDDTVIGDQNDCRTDDSEAAPPCYQTLDSRRSDTSAS